MKLLGIYLGVLGASVVAAFTFHYAQPGQRQLLLGEDTIIENLTAGAFLLSALLAVVLAGKSSTRRPALLAAALMGFVGCLDELSFGERLFDLQMPVIHGKKMDAVHDVFSLAFRVTKDLAGKHPVIVIPLLGAGVIVAALAAWRLKTRVVGFVTTQHREPAFRFAAIFALLILGALVIDLGLKNSDGLFLLEELFELNAAIALGFCAWSLRTPPAPGKTP
jgi:hypothetical protein